MLKPNIRIGSIIEIVKHHGSNKIGGKHRCFHIGDIGEVCKVGGPYEFIQGIGEEYQLSVNFDKKEYENNFSRGSYVVYSSEIKLIQY